MFPTIQSKSTDLNFSELNGLGTPNLILIAVNEYYKLV